MQHHTSYCRAGAASSGMQQPLRLPRRFQPASHPRPPTPAIRAIEWVVRAARYQRVDLPGLSVKKAHSPRMTCADSYYSCSVGKAGTAFDGVCQAIARLPLRGCGRFCQRCCAYCAPLVGGRYLPDGNTPLPFSDCPSDCPQFPSSRLAEIQHFICNALRVFLLGKVPRTVNDDTLIAIGKEFFFSG